MCQQGQSSKVLLICCITAEIRSMCIELMEMKLWNGAHTKETYFNRGDNKVKLGKLHFNNATNEEARHEVLEDINAMDDFTIRKEMQNVKDYLLDLIEGDR